jgi:hypothetical protein
MKNYHLTPNGNRWDFKEEGGAVISAYDTKSQALDGARRTVEREGGSLKIHRADGTFEEERTYPRSEDPVKSPG